MFANEKLDAASYWTDKGNMCQAEALFIWSLYPYKSLCKNITLNALSIFCQAVLFLKKTVKQRKSCY